MQLMKTTTQETMEKFGASDEEMEKAMSRMSEEKFRPSVLETVKGYGISLGIGLILSLIIAAIIRREPPAVAASSESEATS